MSRPFADAATVAALLGLPDRSAFLRRRDDLENQHGFPLPMPHSRRPLMWRASQIRAWVQEHGLPANAPQPEFAPGTNVVLMKEAARV